MKKLVVLVLSLASLGFGQEIQGEASVQTILESSLEAYGPWQGILRLEYAFVQETFNEAQERSFGAGIPQETLGNRFANLGNDYFRLETKSEFPGGYEFDFVVVGRDDAVYLWDRTGNRLGREVFDFSGSPFAKQARSMAGEISLFMVLELQNSSESLELQPDTLFRGEPHTVLRQRHDEGKFSDYFFDQKTHLLTQKLFVEVVNFNEVKAELRFEEYQPIDGIQVATLRHFRDGKLHESTRVKTLKVNPDLAEDWLDLPPGHSMHSEGEESKVTEIAKDLYLIDHVASNRNVLFYAMDEGVLVFGAPLNDRISQFVIGKIKETLPDQPITKVFVSHFHSDHSKGLRQYVHEGAQILIAERSQAYIDRWVTSSPPLLADDLSRSKREPVYDLLSMKTVVQDANHLVEFRVLESSHAEGMAFAYFPQEKIIYEGDLLTVPVDGTLTPANQTNREFAEYLDREGLRFSRIVGHHENNNISPAILREMMARKASAVAYRLAEPDLYPEGIAYSASTHSFYLSSIHQSKIVQVNAETGELKDFIKNGAHGFLPGMGLLVDDENGRLWAIASDIEEEKKGSRIFLFDLKEGDLVKTYSLEDEAKHFFNDLISNGAGTLYVTDSDNHSIYRISPDGSFSLFLQSEEIEFPNGITISDDGEKLFVASFTQGIRILDIASRSFLNSADESSASKGIDGLEIYGNALIGVQNGFQTPSQHRISRYRLNADQSKIIDTEIIDLNNQYFDTPTTAVIVEGSLYCIANSQLGNLNQLKNQVINPQELDPIVVLQYPLDV